MGFVSASTNLVANDTNAVEDVFVRDRSAGTTERISVSSSESQATDVWPNCPPYISGDGRYVVFDSYASNLVSGDSNANYDVFLRDRQAGTTTLLSVSSDEVQGNSGSSCATISENGRYVLFESESTNLTGEGVRGLFLRDLSAGTTTWISRSISTWGIHGISNDGRYVAYEQGDALPSDTNNLADIYVKDRNTGTEVIASQWNSGAQSTWHNWAPRISSDGRYVVWSAGDPLTDEDIVHEAFWDVYRYDVQSGDITWITDILPPEFDEWGGQEYNDYDFPSISSDGRYIAMTTNGTDDIDDIWVVDEVEQSFLHASKPESGSANGNSYEPALTHNAKHVAFTSTASNLVEGGTSGEWHTHYRQIRPEDFIKRPPEEIYGDRASGGYANDPVNTASGNFTQENTDLEYPESVFGLDFVRTYNSLDSSVGVLGAGWTHNFASTVTVQADDSVVYKDWDGRRITFEPNGTGGWISPEEFFGTLTVNPDDSVSVDFFNGATEEFNSTGTLTSRANWDGQQVTMTYSAGLLTGVNSSVGYSVTMTYSGSGRLTEVESSDGRSISYTYGANGALTSFTDPSSGITDYETDSQGRVTRIVDPDDKLVIENGYDSSGRVATQTTTSGDPVTFSYNNETGVTTVGYVGGAQVKYGHDEQGRLTSITDPYNKILSKTYDANGNLTDIEDRRDATVTQTFDSHGNVTARFGPEGVDESFSYDALDRVTSVTDGTGATTLFGYEGSERVPSTVTDPTGAITTYTVVDGLVTSKTDPDGVSVTYTYDSFRNLESATDEGGNTTTHDYDDEGNLLTVTTPLGFGTTYTYDAAGRVLTTTDPTGARTTNTYSDAGRLESVTDPAGATTTYFYNASGWLVSTTAADGAITTYGYNDFGYVTETVNPGGAISRSTYDPLGRVTSTVDPTGVEVTYEYDADGNLKKTTDENGASTTRNYDLRGRLLTETDPLGRTTTYTYTDADQVASVTDPAGAETSYQYDLVGRLVTETAADGGKWVKKYTLAGRFKQLIDPNGKVTAHNYDSLGRLSTVADPEGGITKHFYDADGRVTKTVSPAGLVTTYVHDGASRVTEETSPSGGLTRNFYTTRGELRKTIDPTGGVKEFTYDSVGRLKTAKDPNGGLTRLFYDARGNLTKRIDAKNGEELFAYDLADRLKTKTDPLGRVTTMTYDAVGRLSRVDDPSGRSTTFSYDLAGQVVTRTYGDGSTETFAYDAVGRRTRMVDNTGATLFEWDPVGRQTKVTYPSGKVLTSAYDDAGNRTALTYPDSSSVTFTYDGNNHLTGFAHPSGSASFAQDDDGRITAETLPNGVARAYTYTDGQLSAYVETISGQTRLTTLTRDDADRIVSETTGNSTRSFTYDPAGQLTRVVEGNEITTYTYDEVGNRTHKSRVVGAFSSENINYVYNAAHQLTSIQRPLHSLGVSHDQAGRMTAISAPEGAFLINYDARGLPTSLQRSGGMQLTVNRRYDGDGRLVSSTSHVQGQQTRSDVFTWDSVLPISQIAATSGSGSSINFVYGVNRALAVRGGQSDTFSYDAFGSALPTLDTADLVRGISYDEFGVPEATDPGPPYLEDALGNSGDPLRDGAPLFGYRGELHLGGPVHLRAREYLTGLGRFTSRDPLDGVPGEVTVANPYPYAAGDPINKMDPLGLKPTSDCAMQTDCSQLNSTSSNPAPDAAPDWLVQRAKKLAKQILKGSVLARTTGICGDFTLDVIISIEIQGCVVDDGNRLGQATLMAAGLGGGIFPPPGAAGLSVGYLVSNASSIYGISKGTVCVGLGAGFGLPVNVGVGVEVCFSLNSTISLANLTEKKFDQSFSGVFTVNASLGMSLWSLANGRVVAGNTKVESLWDYPGWVGDICGGRIIENPIASIGSGPLPVCRL